MYELTTEEMKTVAGAGTNWVGLAVAGAALGYPFGNPLGGAIIGLGLGLLYEGGKYALAHPPSVHYNAPTAPSI